MLQDVDDASSVTAPYPRPRSGLTSPKDKVGQFTRHVRSLLHNHPSGDPTPSHADIEMTKQVAIIGNPLGVKVFDHIIVGKDGHASLKGLRLI
jgi:hypothetical protein